MPPQSKITGAERVAKILELEAPKIFNSEFNRGLPATIGDFAREFTRQRLSGGSGITVRRKARAKKKTRGAPFVPTKARAIGFTSATTNQDRLEGKTSTFRSSNPILYNFEKGAVIRSRRRAARGFLTIYDTKKRARKSGTGKKVVLARVRSVRVKARLKFDDSWAGYVPEANKRMGKTRDRAVQRVNKKLGVT